MKLNKLLAGGGIAFVFAVSLFLGACSNSSDSSSNNNTEETGGNQTSTEETGSQEVTAELEEGMFQGDGGKCTVTVDGEKLIIEHTERVDNWQGFRMEEAVDLGTSMSFKVTNLGSGKAWVKVLVKKEDGETDQITHYQLGNGEKKAMPFDQYNADGVPITLEKDKSETIRVWYTEKAKLVVLFDCSPYAFGGSAETDVDKKPETGKIEVSEIKYYTSTSSNENESTSGDSGNENESTSGDSGNENGSTGGDSGNEGGSTGGDSGNEGGSTGTGGNESSDPEEGGEGEEETVLFTLDYTGESVPENYSESATTTESWGGHSNGYTFKANDCLEIKGKWKEYSISPKNMQDLSAATKIKVEFKCSSGAAFADTDNDRFLVGLIKQGGESEGWATTHLSWTAFFDKSADGDIPTDYTTVTKDISWEVKYDAEGKNLPLVDNFADVKGVKIYTQNWGENDILYIKSVKFIK